MENNKELRNTLQELVDKLEMNNLTELRDMVNAKYRIERPKALKEAVKYLKEHSDSEFTAVELASKTGLSVQSLVAGLRNSTVSADYRKKRVPVCYVRLSENGNVDFNHVITFNKEITVYSYKKDSKY